MMLDLSRIRPCISPLDLQCLHPTTSLIDFQQLPIDFNILLLEQPDDLFCDAIKVFGG